MPDGATAVPPDRPQWGFTVRDEHGLCPSTRAPNYLITYLVEGLKKTAHKSFIITNFRKLPTLKIKIQLNL